MSKLSDKLPSIPDYYKQYVDPNVDLETEPTQPCVFHEEKHGRSFSYSRNLGIWRCFGQCHCGGDVVDLHKLNYKLKDRESAIESLYSILGLKVEESLTFEKEEIDVDMNDVYLRRLYSLSVSLANEPNDWLDLDYILSKVPFDVSELEVFCAARGHPVVM